MAVSFTYLFIMFLERRELKKAVFFGFSAFIFHNAIIIVLIPAIFYYLNLKHKIRLKLVLCYGFFIAFSIALFGYLFYRHYFSIEGQVVSNKVIMFGILITALSFVSIFLNRGVNIFTNSFYELLAIFSLFAILVFWNNALLASRIVYLLSIGLPFILTKIYLYSEGKNNFLLNVVVLLSLANLYFAKYWSLEVW
jgi:hypothetical protein